MILKECSKLVLRIIWGHDYFTFENITKEGNIRTMRQVREKIVRKFVRKTIKHNKFKRWFLENNNTSMNTRAGNRSRFKPVPARKGFYHKSPIPTLTKLANTLTTNT